MSDTELPPENDDAPPPEPPVSRRSRRSRRGSFTIGGCLSQTISVWLRNLIPFTILTAVVMSPYVVWTLMRLDQASDEPSAMDIVDLVLSTFLGYVVTSTVVYGTYQQIRGRHAPFGESISRGLSALPKVLTSALLILVFLVLIIAPVGIAMFVAPVLGVLLGFVMIAVLGLFFAGMAPVVPICIFEDIGGMEAIKRSWKLTSNHKFQIFLFVIVLSVLQGVVNAIMMGCVTAMFSDDMEQLTMGFVVVTLVFTVVFTSLQSVSSTVIYHDLRQTKEGIDTEELASIFD